MKRALVMVLFSAVVLVACAPGGSGNAVSESRLVTIYKLTT